MRRAEGPLWARSLTDLNVAVLLITGVALLLGASIALASSPSESLNQPPLPTDTPVPTAPLLPTAPPTVPPGPTETPASPGEGGGTGFLAVLEGYVWEGGDPFRPLSGVTVRYTSDGVSVDVATDRRGYFKFVNVGPDPGVLSLVDSRWQAGGVVAQLPPGWTFRANLAALPKGKTLSSKVTLTCNATVGRATAGQSVTFSLKATNGTQNVVSGLTLGDQLPEGMTVTSVTASRGDMIGRGPKVVSVNLDSLGPGDSATVSIVAQVSQSGPVTVETNRATLFYREGAAVEAPTMIGSVGVPQALPVTGVGLPVATVVALAAILLAVRRLRTRSAM